MKPKSGITREELIKWGGAEVFNQALALVNSGDVLEVEYDDENLEIRGKIEQHDGWGMPVTLKLEREGRVRSLCPCRTNQVYHQICSHVVALGIAIMAMEMDEDEDEGQGSRAKGQGAREEGRGKREEGQGEEVANYIEVPMKPRMAAFVSGSRASLSIEIDARYGEVEIPACSVQAPRTVWIEDAEDPLVRKTRSISAEKAAVKEVEKWGFEPGYREGDLRFYITDQHKVLNFLGAGLPALRRQGWVIDLSERLMKVTDEMPSVVPVVTIKDAPRGAFDVRYEFDAMGRDVSPVEIQAAINRGDGFIMKDGKVVLVDTAAISTMHGVFSDCATTQGGAPPGWFRVSAVHAPYVKASLEQLDCELEDDEAFEWRERAVALGRERGDAKFEPVSLGALDKILRPYQKQGVYWMRFLESSGLSGLLADEMGLGKTLQTLTWLSLPRQFDGLTVGQFDGSKPSNHQTIKPSNHQTVKPSNHQTIKPSNHQTVKPSNCQTVKPSLIVCPTSLVRNWEAEAKKFIPSLKVLVVSGPDRAQVFGRMEEFNLVITSYALLQRDFEDAYMMRDFDVVVLDEAQHIKNRQTKNARAVKMLHSNRRLVLTGTPVENSVADVWSIFDFLMPGYLGDYETFRLSYEMPVQDGGSAGEEALARLKRKLHPFILRRLKKTVAKDLPDKIIKVSYCPISDDAQREYLALLQKTRSEVGDMVRERGFNASKFEILARLMKLRQIASQGKVDAFLEQLEDAIAGGHRILVFSQFVKMLQLIAALLQSKGISFCYLDGSTKDRLGECNRFNMDRSIPVFLISLMAGGTGLNLTGADMVIHYDPWWNPAVEDQATDRAHRIGQKKNVYVVKMIASNTIEEKVLELQRRKQAVISATVSTTDTAVMEKLTADDIAGLLS